MLPAKTAGMTRSGLPARGWLAHSDPHGCRAVVRRVRLVRHRLHACPVVVRAGAGRRQRDRLLAGRRRRQRAHVVRPLRCVRARDRRRRSTGSSAASSPRRLRHRSFSPPPTVGSTLPKESRTRRAWPGLGRRSDPACRARAHGPARMSSSCSSCPTRPPPPPHMLRSSTCRGSTAPSARSTPRWSPTPTTRPRRPCPPVRQTS